MGMAAEAWLRRLVVSIGIGGASYAIMLGIMVLSIVYDRELEPVVTFAFDSGRSIIAAIDSLVSGSHWGQVAANHLRERVNMTHVVLSIPAIIIAAIVIGIPFNYVLGGTRTALQRIAIALISVPATVVLAVGLFTFNALLPDAYAALLRFADLVWQASLNALSASGDTIPGARQTDECRAARLLGASLRDHGSVQHDCVLSCERALRIRLEAGSDEHPAATMRLGIAMQRCIMAVEKRRRPGWKGEERPRVAHWRVLPHEQTPRPAVAPHCPRGRPGADRFPRRAAPIR